MDFISLTHRVLCKSLIIIYGPLKWNFYGYISFEFQKSCLFISKMRIICPTETLIRLNMSLLNLVHWYLES